MKYLALVALIAFCGCGREKSYLTHDHLKIGGDGFHYAVPHNRGNEQEDPKTGCPCEVIANGWSSYANYTNALAHGVESLMDAYDRATQRDRGGLINLYEVYEFEKKLVNKWNLEVTR
jgi:hypothetical protein